MIYAQIKDNEVKNTIILDDVELIPAFSNGFDLLVDISDTEPKPGIGWSYDGVNFAPPVIVEKLSDITARQIRLALLMSGLALVQIDDALNTLDEPTKTFALIEWQYANTFERRNELVTQVGAMLGWTSEQLDDLWRQAITL